MNVKTARLLGRNLEKYSADLADPATKVDVRAFAQLRMRTLTDELRTEAQAEDAARAVELNPAQRATYAEFVGHFGEDETDRHIRNLLGDATADALAMDLEARRG